MSDNIRVGINGFGRIGRNIFRAGFNNPNIEFVAVNDLPVPTETLAHLLKYDSVLGEFNADVRAEKGKIITNGKELKVFEYKGPWEIPWDDLGVRYVIESTGAFANPEKAKGHIIRPEGSPSPKGAKKVIVTAPFEGKEEELELIKYQKTVVKGANEETYDPNKHHVISNGSCTTNCLAQLARVILEEFGIERGLMTTIHSYTNDQRVLDLAHKDLRRARAASLSMIPTTTGAARAISLVLPQLKGKMDGLAIRVPTPNVSLVDLVCDTLKDTTKEELNAVFKRYAEGPLKGVMEYCDKPLVSKDFNGNTSSCIGDAALTMVVGKRMVKALGWYDNEWGYSCRVIDLISYMSLREEILKAQTKFKTEQGVKMGIKALEAYVIKLKGFAEKMEAIPGSMRDTLELYREIEKTFFNWKNYAPAGEVPHLYVKELVIEPVRQKIRELESIF